VQSSLEQKNDWSEVQIMNENSGAVGAKDTFSYSAFLFLPRLNKNVKNGHYVPIANALEVTH
jgi:hypothetical protein